MQIAEPKTSIFSKHKSRSPHTKTKNSSSISRNLEQKWRVYLGGEVVEVVRIMTIRHIALHHLLALLFRPREVQLERCLNNKHESVPTVISIIQQLNYPRFLTNKILNSVQTTFPDLDQYGSVFIWVDGSGYVFFRYNLEYFFKHPFSYFLNFYSHERNKGFNIFKCLKLKNKKNK